MCQNLPFEVKNQLTFYKVRWFQYTFCYSVYSMLQDFLRLCKCSFLNFSEPFHDGGFCHIETSPLICSANQWTDFYMRAASIMKELKWGKMRKNVESNIFFEVQKYYFVFESRLTFFFSNVLIRNFVSTLPNVVKIDVENDNVVSTLSNVVKFNVEKHNVVSTLFYIVNFNVAIHNVVSTLI